MKSKTKQKTKKTNQYQKPISLHGMNEKDVLKELLKSPPMPKHKKSK